MQTNSIVTKAAIPTTIPQYPHVPQVDMALTLYSVLR